MKFVTRLLFLILLASLGFSGNIFAARTHHVPNIHHRGQHEESQQPPAQNQTTPREVENDFFTIVLPEGWSLQKPVPRMPTRASAVFTKGKSMAVNLNMMKVPFPSKQIAENTAKNMRQRGMEVSEPLEQDGFYVIDISKKGVKGKAWFGSNGSIAAITTIFASNPAEANELLSALKPVSEGLVPKSVE